MKLLLVVCSLLFCGFDTQSANLAETQILSVRETAIYEVPSSNKMIRAGKWMVLECEIPGCRVKETTITVNKTKTDYAAAPAQRVTAPNTKKALLLFREVKGSKIGPLKTYCAIVPDEKWTDNNNEKIGDLNLYYLVKAPKSDGIKLNFTPHKRGDTRLGHYDVEIRGINGGDVQIVSRPNEEKDIAEYYLVREKKEQFLRAFKLSDISIFERQLKWAGDLDGDGKIDMLLGNGHNESTDISLFLSTQAKDGELVGKPVTFDGSHNCCVD